MTIEEPARADEQEESLGRIEQGGIPIAAERRLNKLRDGLLPFSSTMSVGEFALSSKLAIHPIGQVLGASVHQVGYQNLPWQTSWTAGQLMIELDVLSDAWEEARRRAISRLAEEARSAGADAVVGVSVRQGEHDWAEGAIEYVVNGTAVRVPSSPMSDGPVLTDLSVQDYWKLYQAGYEPVGLVGAVSVFFVAPSSETQMMRFWTAAQNQEMTDFTQGVYAAREHVLGRLEDQARATRADGIVGVQIRRHSAEHSFSVGGFTSNQERRGLVVTFQAMGTAVREQETVPTYPLQAAIDLST